MEHICPQVKLSSPGYTSQLAMPHTVANNSIHIDVHTCTHKLIYNSLSFSGFTHNDPRSPTAFEVHFISSRCSICQLNIQKQPEISTALDSTKEDCNFHKIAQHSVLPATGPGSPLRTVHVRELNLCILLLFLQRRKQ